MNIKRQDRVKVGTDQRVAKVTLIMTGVPVYLVSMNLWPFDYEHEDTCYMRCFSVKPTRLQLTKFKKEAKSHFRYLRILNNEYN